MLRNERNQTREQKKRAKRFEVIILFTHNKMIKSHGKMRGPKKALKKKEERKQ